MIVLELPEQRPAQTLAISPFQTGGKLRSQAVIKSEMCDVLKQDWLWDCSQDYRDPRPSDMVFTTPATDALFRTRFGHTSQFCSIFLISLRPSRCGLGLKRAHASKRTPSQVCKPQRSQDTLHRSLFVKSQQNRIELVTGPVSD